MKLIDPWSQRGGRRLVKSSGGRHSRELRAFVVVEHWAMPDCGWQVVIVATFSTPSCIWVLLKCDCAVLISKKCTLFLHLFNLNHDVFCHYKAVGRMVCQFQSRSQEALHVSGLSLRTWKICHVCRFETAYSMRDTRPGPFPIPHLKAKQPKKSLCWLIAHHGCMCESK